MKKLAVLLMLLSFVFAACGGSKAAKPAENKGTETKAVASADVKKALIGTWECEEMGDVLAQYGFSVPATFVFNEDGTYTWTFTRGGTKMEGTGKYVLVDTAAKPYKIDFNQTKAGVAGAMKDAPMASAGIFEVTADGKLKTIFYNKKFLPRPEEFGDTDTQVYKKK